MTEERLPGGLTTGAVLIGEVIHKPAAPWTSTVHALLRHLEDAGVDGAPRALGFDDQGRQMLSYLPGDTVGDRRRGRHGYIATRPLSRSAGGCTGSVTRR